MSFHFLSLLFRQVFAGYQQGYERKEVLLRHINQGYA